MVLLQLHKSDMTTTIYIPETRMGQPAWTKHPAAAQTGTLPQQGGRQEMTLNFYTCAVAWTYAGAHTYTKYFFKKKYKSNKSWESQQY